MAEGHLRIATRLSNHAQDLERTATRLFIHHAKLFVQPIPEPCRNVGPIFLLPGCQWRRVINGSPHFPQLNLYQSDPLICTEGGTMRSRGSRDAARNREIFRI